MFLLSMLYNFYINKKKIRGDWAWGIGDWELGIGDWAKSPIPNPQSPIPNPQQKLYRNLYLFN